MATATRGVSLSSSSGSSNRDVPPSSSLEEATVEESVSELELIRILRAAAASGSQSLESLADAIADAARPMSGADGTALGLEANGIIVCRARSGHTAPPIGAPISAESGISGACLRTATMLVCHDAMADSRVDAEVCRSLGIRSVVAVPVRGPMRVAGILEAFSARANAFDGDALAALRDLAEIAETAYNRKASHSGRVVKVQTAATKPAPEIRPLVQPKPPVPAQVLTDVWQPGKNRVLWVIGAALALLLIGGVAWWAWHTPADESTSATTQNVHAATPEPTPSMPAIALVPKPTPGVAPSHSDRSRSGIVQNAAEIKPIDLRSVQGAAGSRASDTIEVRVPKAGASESAPVPEPPSVSFSPSANKDTLAQLSSVPDQMPVEQPRVSQFVEATLVHRVEPNYSLEALAKHLQGRVTLLATIATDGTVQHIDVQAGPPILAQAAKTAIQQWRYRPAMLNGTPVEVRREITVLFKQP